MLTMAALEQWTDCLSDNHGKRPHYSPGQGKGVILAKAIEMASRSTLSPNYGFLFTKDDPYIGIDVDVDPTGKSQNATTEIPPELLFFLNSNPTHAHYSPSGNGLHLIYKLDPIAVAKVNSLNMKQRACRQADGALFNGDWRWDSSFLTFTPNTYNTYNPSNSSSTQTISTIDYDTLVMLIGPTDTGTLATQVAPIVDIRTGLKMQAYVPTLTDLERVLQDVPSTFNHLAKKACKTLKHSQPSTNYEYWVLVGQACAHTSLMLQATGASETEATDIGEATEALFVNWSSRDPDFVSIEDVQAKYRSLLASTQTKFFLDTATATYKVLLTLARGAILDFPVLIGKALLPDMGSIQNALYLMDYEELSVWSDTMSGGFSIKGPEETISKRFRPHHSTHVEPGCSVTFDAGSLDVAMLPFFQNRYKQSMSPAQARSACRQLMLTAHPTNAFRDWIDSKPWDGESRLEAVCNSIDYADHMKHNAPLYHSYIEKSLLSMIGIHYWPEDHPKIPAMLVLTGPQHTYKSSWAEWLLPIELKNYMGMATTDVIIAGGTDRDRLLSTRAVLVINECETLFIPRYEQRIKSSVDQEIVTYRELYMNTPVSRQRTALIIGTTNKPDLYTGTMGTRKIWQIPVKTCNSYLIKDCDKQQLYAEIKALLAKRKAEKPNELIQLAWQQSFEERQQVEEINRESKGSMGTDALLAEIFGDPLATPFDIEDYKGLRGLVVRKGNPYSLENKPNAWTLTPLLRFMRDRFPDDIIDRRSLRYAAISYCELFTQSKHAIVQPFKSISKAERPVFRGVLEISKSEKYYLFPAIGHTPDESAFSEVE